MSNKGLVVSLLLSGALVVMAAFSGPAIGDHGQSASQQNQRNNMRANWSRRFAMPRDAFAM